ncbi:hypothetical protein PG996_012377 [Apiospora saccharicola]|uniref:Uncharacterized protein n=1 Tax=Apiospora saccharicola TaxID=335842 RepID=A0ABR1U4G8_9PEZI
MVAKDIHSRFVSAKEMESIKRRPKTWKWYAKLESCPWMEPETMEMLRDPTQEELMVWERGQREFMHLVDLLKNNLRRAPGRMFKPRFPPTGSPTGMDRRHAKDCRNKSVAMYTIGHDPLPIFNYLYRKWLRPFKNPIEYGQFVAKIIGIDLGECRRAVSQPDSVEELNGVMKDIIQLHQQIVRDADDVYTANTDYYEFMPLFKSIIIVTKELPRGVQDDFSQMQVYLILTGNVEGLSAPMSFDAIYANGQDLSIGDNCGPQPTIVLTTLETAVGFLQEMEKREQSVFGTIPDPNLPPPTCINEAGMSYTDMKFLRGSGWTGEDLIGPSHLWIDTKRWPKWFGGGKFLHTQMEHMEDPNITTSKLRIEQMYDPARFHCNIARSKRQHGLEKEVEDKQSKHLKLDT